MEFDRVITTTAMLKHVAKIARILGPLGLMPTVKKGNVTDDVVKAINETNAQFDFKSDSHGVVKAPIGKVTFTEQELVDNALAIVKTIHEIGQPTCKEQFVEKVYVKSSQSPAILIKDLNKRFVVEEEEE
jgi:large subunit ribosomal protein L1